MAKRLQSTARWLRWLTPGLEIKRWLLLLMVAEQKGLAVVWPSVAELGVRGIVTRPFEGPVPEVEYGLVWLSTHASPPVTAFGSICYDVV